MYLPLGKSAPKEWDSRSGIDPSLVACEGDMSSQSKLRLQFRNFFERAPIDNGGQGSAWGDKKAKQQTALR